MTNKKTTGKRPLYFIKWEEACEDPRITNLDFRVLVKISQITNRKKWWKITTRELAEKLHSTPKRMSISINRLARYKWIVLSEKRGPRKAGKLRLSVVLTTTICSPKDYRSVVQKTTDQVRTNTTNTNTIKRKEDLIRKRKERELSDKEEVLIRRIVRWAYEKAAKRPSIPQEAYKRAVTNHLKRLGYDKVFKLFEFEENAVTFLTNLKSI